MVNMAGDRSNDPDMIFDALRRAADELHMGEVVEKTRANLKKLPTARINGKSVGGGGPEMDGDKSTPVPTRMC